MKKIILLCIASIFTILYGYGIDSQKVQYLDGLCRVWGYLKYYHPQIQQGKIDWDSTLIETIPKVFNSNSDEEYNKIINHLILLAGRIEKLKKPFNYLPDDTTYNNFDYSWINNEKLFTKDNSKLLFEVVENYKPRKNVYIKNEISKYINEEGLDKYYNVESYNPDTAHSLLALFRYWNAVNYFFGYKKITDENWNDVLVEFIPKIIESANSTKFYLTIAELVARTNDCHAFFDNYYFNHEIGPIKSVFDWRRVPMTVKFVENKTVILNVRQKIADTTHLKRGDIILAINGNPIDEIRNELRKYCGCSHALSIDREINAAIFMSYFVPKNKEFSITVSDSNGAIRTETITNDNMEGGWSGLRDSTVRLIVDSIGYMNLEDMSIKDIRKGIKYFQSAKAIIFDLRNNSDAALLPIGMRLPDRKGIPFANYYEGDLKYPGSFKFSEDKDWYLGLRALHKKYRGKVIFLINENVQSTYEWQLMSLQTDFKIILVGNNTAGADGGASSFLIQDNINTYFTFDAVFYSDGRPTQRIGIIPDIYVTPTVSGIREGKDEVLERAVEFVNTGK